jgi:cobalt-zinc-cadmium efflux system membrane fusion protein
MARPAPPPEADSAPAPAPEVIDLTADAQRDAGVTVTAATSTTRVDTLAANAVLALNEKRTARVGSVVEGTVVETFSDVGDRVRRGQVLANLHSHVVHDSWAEYRKAMAERRRFENELAFARSGAERAERLLRDKAISAQEHQRALADRVAAEEQLDIAKTEVRRAEEALEHLGITNSEDPTGESGEQIPARAPFAGVVLERLVTAGTAVTPGTAMFLVSDLSALWALAEVDEAMLARVGVNRPVEVRVSAYPAEVFHGRVTFVGDTVNPKTRRIVVRCELPNPTGRLKPEMYATVMLDTGEAREIVAVPGSAVQDAGGRTIVFVEERPGRFRPRDVKLGAEAQGLVEVREGLRAGERIVTAGSFLLKSTLLGAGAPEGD